MMIMSKLTDPPNRFQPSRKSSEAPEVVQLPDPVYQSSQFKDTLLSLHSAELQKGTTRSSSPWCDDDGEVTEVGTLNRRVATYQSSRKNIVKKKWNSKRSFVTVVTVLFAFLVGGGTGGGVGATLMKNSAR